MWAYSSFFLKDELGKELVSATNEALEIGIRACGPGKPFKAIGSAIQEFVSPLGLSISQTYSGHGIGTVFHRPPWILHHRKVSPQCRSSALTLTFGTIIYDPP